VRIAAQRHAKALAALQVANEREQPMEVLDEERFAKKVTAAIADRIDLREERLAIDGVSREETIDELVEDIRAAAKGVDEELASRREVDEDPERLLRFAQEVVEDGRGSEDSDALVEIRERHVGLWLSAQRAKELEEELLERLHRRPGAADATAPRERLE